MKYIVSFKSGAFGEQSFEMFDSINEAGARYAELSIATETNCSLTDILLFEEYNEPELEDDFT